MAKEENCIMEDPMIVDLLAAKGKLVEVYAFGITYVGKLVNVDSENGFISVSDAEDTAILELERIEHFNVLEE